MIGAIKSIQSILEENDLIIGSRKEDSSYISEPAGGGDSYPYRIIQDGTDDYFVYDETLNWDLKALTSYLSNVRNYKSLVNELEAYKDCKNKATRDEAQTSLDGEWKTMIDQLATVVPYVVCEGGIAAIPNLDYLKEVMASKSLTDARRSFSSIMRACITHNYKEAERINATLDGNKKIKCSEKWREVTKRIIADENREKNNGGKNGI